MRVAQAVAGDLDINDTADAIIAVVREAMLSDEAMSSLELIRMPADDYRRISKRMMRGIYDMNTDSPKCKADLRAAYQYALPIVLGAVLGKESDVE